MKKIELDIYGIAPSQKGGSYSLILAEVNGDRKLPIIVGPFEAQAIAIPLEGIEVDRPLTHDLFLSLSKKLDFTISEVFIYQIKEGIFYAHLIVDTTDAQTQIDCRTSDAIAIAVRFNCPIYTTEEVLEAAGIEIDEGYIQKPGRDDDAGIPNIGEQLEHSALSSKSIEELEEMLEEALRNEDYLKAAQIRDEIDNR